jgi:pimeloyl-ACP methyl ester carboxylesterase
VSAATIDKSTNGRMPTAPWPLRLGLAATAAAWPSLAVRAGERLFLTPPRRHRSAREPAALVGGEGFFVGTGQEKLQAWRFGAGPTVLLAHGWGSSGARMAPLVAPLTAAGCSVVVFDAPAHGASTGRVASGACFAEAISAVAAQAGARAAVGHSLGATALGWALASGLELEAAVMLCPPSNVGPFFGQFCAALGLPSTIGAAIHERIRRRYGIGPEDFDLCRQVGAASVPLLVIHDRDDREVSWTDGEAVARAWPSASFSCTSGLGHRGVVKDAAVAATIVSFLRQRLAKCDCGQLAQGDGTGFGPTCAQCALERELFDPSLRA